MKRILAVITGLIFALTGLWPQALNTVEAPYIIADVAFQGPGSGITGLNLNTNNLNYTPPFTGGVSRSQLSKNQDIITPQDFGAIADGNSHALSTVTSLGGINTVGWTLIQWQIYYPGATSLTNEIDGLAIQAACNACPAGGKVSIRGTGFNYLTSDTIYVKPSTTVEFQGSFLKLVHVSSNGAVMVVLAGGACIINPLIDANNINGGVNGENGIGITNLASQVQIFGGVIKNCWRLNDGNGGRGVQVEMGATDVLVDGTVVTDSGIAFNSDEDNSVGTSFARNILFTNVTGIRCQCFFKTFQVNATQDPTGYNQSVRMIGFQARDCGSYQGVFQFSKSDNVMIANGQVFNNVAYNSGSVDSIFRGRAQFCTIDNMQIVANVATSIFNLAKPTDGSNALPFTNNNCKNITFNGTCPYVIADSTGSDVAPNTDNTVWDVTLYNAPSTGFVDTQTKNSSYTSFASFKVGGNVVTASLNVINALYNTMSSMGTGMKAYGPLFLDEINGNVSLGIPGAAATGKGMIVIGQAGINPTAAAHAGQAWLYMDATTSDVKILTAAGNVRTIAAN